METRPARPSAVPDPAHPAGGSARNRADLISHPAPGLLEEVLLDPARDRTPGARPIVSVREQEDPRYLADVDALRSSPDGSAALTRRGVWHGEWIELNPARLPARARGPDASLAAIAARWHAARPIVLPAAAAELLGGFAEEIDLARDLHPALEDRGGLRRWLVSRSADLEPDFLPRSRGAPLADPGRDLERVLFDSVPPSGRGSGRGRAVHDLWVKSAWLSTHEGDASMRVRIGFGRERVDDASGDLLRHRLVAELGGRLFPESALVTANPGLAGLVERLVAEPVLFTQPIAYWNAPDGGALFHHDAFAEEEEDGARPGQRGVCYLQLSGRTAWLALSIEDLALRVREFAGCLAEGDLPWVRAQLFPDAAGARHLEALLEDEPGLLSELALPGCGRLGPLVNRGPEFTAWLADAGHASLLRPGDAILLPNHGLARTAMHSVFCAGDEVAYALSLAIRADREDQEIAEAAPENASARSAPTPGARAARARRR